MLSICKNPDCPREGKRFRHERAGALYCSGACRVAAHRKQHTSSPATEWLGKAAQLSKAVRSTHADGSPALSNEELGDRLIELAAQADGGNPKTGRRFYYLALSYGYIRPDMSASDDAKKSRDAAYNRITRVLGALRMQSRLSWDAVLDLTRELVQWRFYDSPREARERMRRTYDEDRWLGQKYFPVFIVEKDTLEPVCEPMAQTWQMSFASSRGYSSGKLQYDTARLLRQRQARTGQVAIIYFISDHDPSGLDLQRDWEETLKNFGVVSILIRIGLTPAQIQGTDEHGTPLQDLGIEVKPSDSRSKGYIAVHGNWCWEADILPAAEIERALDRHVAVWLDRKLWDRRAREIERARGLL
jgi:hypothetical protein